MRAVSNGLPNLLGTIGPAVITEKMRRSRNLLKGSGVSRKVTEKEFTVLAARSAALQTRLGGCAFRHT
jgi:hypothetical protein